MANEKRKEAGAIWMRVGPNTEYLSGTVEIDGVKHSFKAFPNKFKEQERHPDYRIFLDADREQKTADVPAMDQSDVPF